MPSSTINQNKKRLLKPWRDSPVLLEEAEKQFWLLNEIHLHVKLEEGIAAYIGVDRSYIAKEQRQSTRRLHLLFDIWCQENNPTDLIGDTIQVLKAIAQDFARLDSLTVNMHVNDFSRVTSATPAGAAMRSDVDDIIEAIRAIPTKETILMRTDRLSHPRRWHDGRAVVPLGLVHATLKGDEIESAYANDMATWTDSMIRDAYLQVEMGRGLRIS